MSARERFRVAYRAAIERAARERPEQYAAVASQDLDAFTARWLLAVETGNYNHDGHAMRWTCKALGIPHTRKAIAAFLGSAPAGPPGPRACEPARKLASVTLAEGTPRLVQSRVEYATTDARDARVILRVAQDATGAELRRLLLAEGALAPTVGVIGDEIRRARAMGVALLPGERRKP